MKNNIPVWRLIQNENIMGSRLAEIFGDNPQCTTERLGAYRSLIHEYERVFGAIDDVFLIRAPARINLKGMHVDHRGGHLNYMAIDREIVMAVGPRTDDSVVLQHRESESFGPRTFRIGEALPPDKRGDWLGFIDQVDVVQGDWANYVQAGVLKLQDHFPVRTLSGMNILVTGNIPMAGGLSSSSALVVASVESCLQVNNLELARDEKTILCGEAEWFVGTRGGAGDHAAIIYGQRGHLTSLHFFPLTIQSIPLPAGYNVVVCNSLVRAHKSDGARSAFNERVATYEIAMLLIRHLYPAYAARLTHLRDLDAEFLGVQESELYRILASLPEHIARRNLLLLLENDQDKLSRIFQTHDNPEGGYRVRSICLYGMSECARSRVFSDVLRSGDVDKAGQLMYLSHDGDRVVSFVDGESRPWDGSVTDDFLKDLMVASDQDLEGSHLWQQSGSYRCSCEEIDHLVDISKTVPGVAGANL
ncbi:MAG: hypothetical protein HOH43_28205, partial [Candidatus Latescibacteria bacterium]|nr:hypothetical protein [Candidatus Latescibacterota bacterium]